VRCPEGSSTKQAGSFDASACLCAAHRYDSVRLGTIWGHPEGFNDSLSRKVMAASKRDIEASLRCVGCSAEDSFMTCAVDKHGVIGNDPVIAAGFAELRLLGAEPDTQNGSDSNSSARLFNSSARHFFACPFGEAACPQVPLGQGAAGCSEAFHGLLCAECTGGYAQTGRGCAKCDSGESAKFLVVVSLAVLVGGLLAWKIANCSSTRMAGIVLWLGVLQRIWPRISQSLNIFVGNYQIVSKIPLIAGLPFPTPFHEICEAIGDVVSGAMELLPAVACTLGGSFGRRLLFKVTTPVLLLGLIFIVYRVRVFLLIHHRMPIQDGTRRAWKEKVARALVRSSLMHTGASWGFAMIYLLYPSTSAAGLVFC
jgi:hypothetical protein